MNKSPIPSRNKRTTHEDFCYCPYCNKKIYYANLVEDTEDVINDYKKFLNTIIIHCCYDFVPWVTYQVDYIYSGHCHTKDKKLIKNTKNNS